jgi:peptidoglycan hydrolase-like protein with peptidoglycan-binding domain
MEVEAGLHLGPLDRQHVQVALTVLGFNTLGTDGVFGQHTHDMVAAWQKSRSYPDTGYLTGPQNQELLRTASLAITKFDDDQKKADADKAKAAAVAPVPAPAAAAAPPVAGGSADGVWNGTYQCGPNNVGGGFTMPVRMAVQGGHGVYTLPIASPTQTGNHSLALTVNGKTAILQRTFLASGGKNAGNVIVVALNARFEGGTITGTGLESSGGRTCTVILTR